ncbi:MAG: molybdopterin-dependent oxidoreductase, partial [Pseudomonadota bacterium]
MTSLLLVADHCEMMLCFGGISTRTAQISPAGTSSHKVGAWLARLEDAGVRVLSIAPERGEAREWLATRPGTDTALILALIHCIVAAGREDRAFLSRCTSGWEALKAYVMGEADGVAKSANWAQGICDIPAPVIEELAETLAEKRSMISMAWGLQRADHGEQPIWAGLALAAVLGQIGQPGTGYSFGYGSVTAVGRPVRWIPWPSLPKLRNAVEDFIPVARIAD